MLIGEPWVLDHLRNPRGRPGHTLQGRSWSDRVRAENAGVTFRCDTCGWEVKVKPLANLDGLRYWVQKAVTQEKTFGRHLCRTCAEPCTSMSRRATRASAEYHARRAAAPSWQSTAGVDKLQDVYERARQSRIKTAAAKTPEERGQGVRKQWAAMSEEAKQIRAAKISVAGKAGWAALSETARSARIQNMIKGLPRSKASDTFRTALVEAGLYEGFESEVVITGFVADECSKTRKVILEFFGDYYHCNPRKYSPDFYNTTLHMTAAQKWQYDRRRLAAFRKSGYTPMVVWENEWNSDPIGVLIKVQAFLEKMRCE